MLNLEWVGLKQVAKEIILVFHQKGGRNCVNKQIPQIQLEIILFLSQIDALFLHYCAAKFSLFHAQCFISDSVLACEDE